MKIEHKGLHTNRLHPDAENPREVAFSQEWAEQNERRTGKPHGTLEYLLGDGTGPCSFAGIVHPTQDQATVAATVIQWLGSNVGMSFLANALEKCGHVIERSDRGGRRPKGK
jgi:hypothetical protein